MKIGVPDRILLKPGPLDEREWEIMKNGTAVVDTFFEMKDEILNIRDIYQDEGNSLMKEISDSIDVLE